MEVSGASYGKAGHKGWAAHELTAAGASIDVRGLAEALHALEPRACLRRLPGRETFLVDLDGPRALEVDGDAAGLDAQVLAGVARPAVVKRHRSGERRDLWFELLHGRRPRSPARREAENLIGLARVGLPVPAPLLWSEARGRSLVVIEYLPHTRSLRRVSEAGDPAADGLLVELAGLVARMHAAGWYHRDLYLEHVVLAEHGLALLDAGRARQQARPRPRWLAKDLAALLHSAPAGSLERVGLVELWLAELERLGAGGRGDLAAWNARIAERLRSIRSHAPRHRHQSGAASGPFEAHPGG